MDLPPQPQPSAIEVTCEDDPLTMEWPAAFGNSKRAGKAVLWGSFGAFLVLVSLCLLATPFLITWAPGAGWTHLGTVLVCALPAALAGFQASRAFRRMTTLASDTGSARLVLHHDSLIWVPGGGSIPQVYRKSEVTGISAIPTLKPRRVGFVLEDAPHPRFHVVLKGRFAPGDLTWLAEVLGRWFATKP